MSSTKANTLASWIGAAEAAGMLDVSRATLYAYVSRGFVRSRAAAGATRERRYSRDDVERLRRRTEERRDPDKAAAHALQWGMPILESSITLIDAERLFYRGHDAVTLSRTRSVAEVAALIWSGGFEAAAQARSGRPFEVDTGKRLGAVDVAPELPFVTRAQAALAIASAHDPAAFDLQPASVMRSGWRILSLLTQTAAAAASVRVAPASPAGRASLVPRTQRTKRTKRTTRGVDAPSAIDATLADAWQVTPRGIDLLRAALILCADHELNVSSFTARCVASAGSHPYAVVIAGLAALEGTKHGGASARVEAMLASMRRTRDPRGALTARLRRGETIDGFGHPLYPGGDPRAVALLTLMRERYTRSAGLAFVLECAKAGEAVVGEKPNLDFALAAVSRMLRLPAGSALTLFAIGRTIGWIGHAIEQYATGQLIRPRARYSGVPVEGRASASRAPAVAR
jgi:citrate synthase